VERRFSDSVGVGDGGTDSGTEWPALALCVLREGRWWASRPDVGATCEGKRCADAPVQ
jgi:hypothetical protein